VPHICFVRCIVARDRMCSTAFLRPLSRSITMPEDIQGSRLANPAAQTAYQNMVADARRSSISSTFVSKSRLRTIKLLPLRRGDSLMILSYCLIVASAFPPEHR
jgi:hypothetical protein